MRVTLPWFFGAVWTAALAGFYGAALWSWDSVRASAVVLAGEMVVGAVFMLLLGWADYRRQKSEMEYWQERQRGDELAALLEKANRGVDEWEERDAGNGPA